MIDGLYPGSKLAGLSPRFSPSPGKKSGLNLEPPLPPEYRTASLLDSPEKSCFCSRAAENPVFHRADLEFVCACGGGSRIRENVTWSVSVLRGTVLRIRLRRIGEIIRNHMARARCKEVPLERSTGWDHIRLDYRVLGVIFR